MRSKNRKQLRFADGLGGDFNWLCVNWGIVVFSLVIATTNSVTSTNSLLGYARAEIYAVLKLMAFGDAYHKADLVAFPSTYDGFGNAFLELVYYKKPLFCNRDTIFQTDIEPFGFRGVVMDGFMTEKTVEEARRVLTNKHYRRQMVDHNYEIAKKSFSYQRAKSELFSTLTGPRRFPGTSVFTSN